MSERAFVVSDLHLGAGAEEPQLEDFDQDEQLVSFIDRIAKPGTTLFINGDFIDFPQIPPYDVGPADHLLWDEASSIAKLESALRAHPKPFASLGKFVKSGGRLCLHAGNHDLDLAWKGVRDRLRVAIGADFAHSLVGSMYHGVLIEHGHMFTPENAPKKADAFIHRFGSESDAKDYLERVWGTDFMLHFYNDLERTHPFADNVKPMIMLAYYGLKNRWVGGRDLIRLVLFLKRSGVPWSGIASAVLDGPPPADKVVESIDDDDWRRVIVERMAEDPAFEKDLTEGIKALPADQQALIAGSGTVKIGVGEARDTGAAATLGIFRDERQHRAANERLAQKDVKQVVFGHTHETIEGDLDGCLWNSGTWLPCLDMKRADVKAKIKANGVTLDMLADRTLYVTSRMVVQIVPDPPGRSMVKLVPADDVT